MEQFVLMCEKLDQLFLQYPWWCIGYALTIWTALFTFLEFFREKDGDMIIFGLIVLVSLVPGINVLASYWMYTRHFASLYGRLRNGNSCNEFISLKTYSKIAQYPDYVVYRNGRIEIDVSGIWMEDHMTLYDVRPHELVHAIKYLNPLYYVFALRSGVW